VLLNRATYLDQSMAYLRAALPVISADRAKQRAKWIERSAKYAAERKRRADAGRFDYESHEFDTPFEYRPSNELKYPEPPASGGPVRT
jgi:hypothetical protein